MIKNTSIKIKSRIIKTSFSKYRTYDVRIPLDDNFIESICGATYSKSIRRIIYNSDSLHLSDEDVKSKTVSLNKLILFIANVNKDKGKSEKLKELKTILEIND